jgi:branched-chain amino acid transport system permease protein
LSLIYGLMGVLNFAHGAFITFGAYAAWWLTTQISTSFEGALLAATAFGLVVGGALGALVEFVFIRPLYRRPIEQVLVTVGLALSLGALVFGIWGADPQLFPVPDWMLDTTTILGANIPNDRFVEIAVAVIVLIGLISLLRFTRIGLVSFLRFTRVGLIIRAGVENRAMVTALGIDVRKTFTLVFALGGALAALAGVLSGIYFGSVDPGRGTSLLIFAFIVVVIGGFGSIEGSAVAAVVVGLVQQYANYYVADWLDWSGAGDVSVMLLLATVLLLRPEGLAPKVAH